MILPQHYHLSTGNPSQTSYHSDQSTGSHDQGLRKERDTEVNCLAKLETIYYISVLKWRAFLALCITLPVYTERETFGHNLLIVRLVSFTLLSSLCLILKAYKHDITYCMKVELELLMDNLIYWLLTVDVLLLFMWNNTSEVCPLKTTLALCCVPVTPIRKVFVAVALKLVPAVAACFRVCGGV